MTEHEQVIHDVCMRQANTEHAAFVAGLIAEANRLNRVRPRFGFYHAPKRQYLVRFWPFAELRVIPWGLPGPSRWQRFSFWLGAMTTFSFKIAGEFVLMLLVLVCWLAIVSIFAACCR